MRRRGDVTDGSPSQREEETRENLRLVCRFRVSWWLNRHPHGANIAEERLAGSDPVHDQNMRQASLGTELFAEHMMKPTPKWNMCNSEEQGPR